jgi:hypothetical protein
VPLGMFDGFQRSVTDGELLRLNDLTHVFVHRHGLKRVPGARGSILVERLPQQE